MEPLLTMPLRASQCLKCTGSRTTSIPLFLSLFATSLQQQRDDGSAGESLCDGARRVQGDLEVDSLSTSPHTLTSSRSREGPAGQEGGRCRQSCQLQRHRVYDVLWHLAVGQVRAVRWQHDCAAAARTDAQGQQPHALPVYQSVLCERASAACNFPCLSSQLCCTAQHPPPPLVEGAQLDILCERPLPDEPALSFAREQDGNQSLNEQALSTSYNAQGANRWRACRLARIGARCVCCKARSPNCCVGEVTGVDEALQVLTSTLGK